MCDDFYSQRTRSRSSEHPDLEAAHACRRLLENNADSTGYPGVAAGGGDGGMREERAEGGTGSSDENAWQSVLFNTVAPPPSPPGLLSPETEELNYSFI